jgi:hypothetical protein
MLLKKFSTYQQAIAYACTHQLAFVLLHSIPQYIKCLMMLALVLCQACKVLVSSRAMSWIMQHLLTSMVIESRIVRKITRENRVLCDPKVQLYADDVLLLSSQEEELAIILKVTDKVSAGLGGRIIASRKDHGHSKACKRGVSGR